MFDIWNEKKEIAECAYEKDNYKITVTEENNNECVIYFSSNDIWFPNTEETFVNRIIEEDRYEWIKRPYRVGKKNIFIRDIYKSWYVQGINREISSVDILIEWLKKETIGYEVVCIGSSAGGYMAALAGTLLNAKLVIAFSAQFCLYHKAYFDLNPFLQKYQKDENREKYFDISHLVNSGEVPLVYVYPEKVAVDAFQSEKIKESENLIKFALSASHHGIVLYKCNLPKFLNMSFEEIRCLQREKGKSPFWLSVEMSGLKRTLTYCMREVYKKIKRKVRKR